MSISKLDPATSYRQSVLFSENSPELFSQFPQIATLLKSVPQASSTLFSRMHGSFAQMNTDSINSDEGKRYKRLWKAFLKEVETVKETHQKEIHHLQKKLLSFGISKEILTTLYATLNINNDLEKQCALLQSITKYPTPFLAKYTLGLYYPHDWGTLIHLAESCLNNDASTASIESFLIYQDVIKELVEIHFQDTPQAFTEAETRFVKLLYSLNFKSAFLSQAKAEYKDALIHYLNAPSELLNQAALLFWIEAFLHFSDLHCLKAHFPHESPLFNALILHPSFVFCLVTHQYSSLLFTKLSQFIENPSSSTPIDRETQRIFSMVSAEKTLIKSLLNSRNGSIEKLFPFERKLLQAFKNNLLFLEILPFILYTKSLSEQESSYLHSFVSQYPFVTSSHPGLPLFGKILSYAPLIQRIYDHASFSAYFPPIIASALEKIISSSSPLFLLSTYNNPKTLERCKRISHCLEDPSFFPQLSLEEQKLLESIPQELTLWQQLSSFIENEPVKDFIQIVLNSASHYLLFTKRVYENWRSTVFLYHSLVENITKCPAPLTEILTKTDQNTVLGFSSHFSRMQLHPRNSDKIHPLVNTRKGNVAITSLGAKPLQKASQDFPRWEELFLSEMNRLFYFDPESLGLLSQIQRILLQAHFNFGLSQALATISGQESFICYPQSTLTFKQESASTVNVQVVLNFEIWGRDSQEKITNASLEFTVKARPKGGVFSQFLSFPLLHVDFFTSTEKTSSTTPVVSLATEPLDTRHMDVLLTLFSKHEMAKTEHVEELKRFLTKWTPNPSAFTIKATQFILDNFTVFQSFSKISPENHSYLAPPHLDIIRCIQLASYPLFSLAQEPRWNSSIELSVLIGILTGKTQDVEGISLDSFKQTFIFSNEEASLLRKIQSSLLSSPNPISLAQTTGTFPKALFQKEQLEFIEACLQSSLLLFRLPVALFFHWNQYLASKPYLNSTVEMERANNTGGPMRATENFIYDFLAQELPHRKVSFPNPKVYSYMDILKDAESEDVKMDASSVEDFEIFLRQALNQFTLLKTSKHPSAIKGFQWLISKEPYSSSPSVFLIQSLNELGIPWKEECLISLFEDSPSSLSTEYKHAITILDQDRKQTLFEIHYTRYLTLKEKAGKISMDEEITSPLVIRAHPSSAGVFKHTNLKIKDLLKNKA